MTRCYCQPRPVDLDGTAARGGAVVRRLSAYMALHRVEALAYVAERIEAVR